MTHDQAMKKLQRQFPDWEKGDLEDVVSSVSPYMSQDARKVQKLYQKYRGFAGEDNTKEGATMKELIDRLEEGRAKKPPELHEVYQSLGDFQRESAALTRAIGEAYNQALHLKGMWDRFEEIPKDQQKMYDNTMRVMGELGKTKSRAAQTQMTLRKY